MENALPITSLPDDPRALKQIIVDLSRRCDERESRVADLQRERDELQVAKLRLEVELLRLKKWYYGPRADRLQTPGDAAQLLLEFACDLESRR
jgi:hypothetical protein